MGFREKRAQIYLLILNLTNSKADRKLPNFFQASSPFLISPEALHFLCAISSQRVCVCAWEGFEQQGTLSPQPPHFIAKF